MSYHVMLCVHVCMASILPEQIDLSPSAVGFLQDGRGRNLDKEQASVRAERIVRLATGRAEMRLAPDKTNLVKLRYPNQYEPCRGVKILESPNRISLVFLSRDHPKFESCLRDDVLLGDDMQTIPGPGCNVESVKRLLDIPLRYDLLEFNRDYFRAIREDPSLTDRMYVALIRVNRK